MQPITAKPRPDFLRNAKKAKIIPNKAKTTTGAWFLTASLINNAQNPKAIDAIDII